MRVATIGVMMVLSIHLALSGCTSKGGKIPVDTASSVPGGTITIKGETNKLVGTPLKVGDRLPSTLLVDAFTMNRVDLSSQFKGKVLFVSIVPSLDTKVCEAQTHYLGEQGSKLSPEIVRITVSRDTPFAQKRFAEEAKLTKLTYLSDYRDGSFGRATGLLIDDNMLLARSVILVDKSGVVRYIQVVPELTHLPDMESAFTKAEALVAEK
jgi:thiol peroxidase